MSTSQSRDIPRKKRTRARAPKVRTGCKTCKRRHLKCDETKPSCLRCLRDKWTCDGYTQPSPGPLSATGNEGLVLPSHPKPVGWTSPLRPALTDGTLVNSADSSLLYHVRQLMVPDLEMIDGTREFWHDIVLPVSQSNQAVRHALCALGASHQRFLASYPGQPYSIDHSIDYDYQANLKYSAAIASIQPVMAENSSSNIKTALLCCTVFICIENLHKRYADSIRHLRAGYKLLESLRTGQSRSPPSESINKENDNDLLNILTTMFASLGKSVGAFTGDTSFSDMLHYTPTLDIGSPKTPFSTISEAETCLSALNSFFDNCLFGREAFGESAGQIGCASPASAAAESMTQALDLARPLFLTWSSRFQLFNAFPQTSQFTPYDKRRLALLSLYNTIWVGFLKMDLDGAGFRKSDCETILERIEEIINLDNSQDRPVFAFGGHLICELSTICASCTDVEIRNKAITLLRSMRRREGVWDSWEVANIHEKVFRALEEKSLSVESLPWVLTELSQKVSDESSA